MQVAKRDILPRMYLIINQVKQNIMLKKTQKFGQGYNDRLDERLGITGGKASGKKMTYDSRRAISKGTRKPKGSYGFYVR